MSNAQGQCINCNVRLLVDVINEDLWTEDGITESDMLDWLAICGLTVRPSGDNEASEAYVALNSGLRCKCCESEMTA